VAGLAPIDEPQFAEKLPPMDSDKDVPDERWLPVGVFEERYIAPTVRGSNVRTLRHQNRGLGPLLLG
jgi:hypothetical protein